MDERRFRRAVPPDEIELELLAIGALDDDPDRKAAAARAAENGMAGLAADIERFRAGWAAAPPLPRPATAANNTRWYGLLVAIAAAIVIAVLGWSHPDDDGGFRAMGRLPVDLVVLREGATLPATTPVVAGDRLDLAFVAPHAGYAWVGTVQDDGQVTVLYRTPAPLAAGQRFDLPGAVELDAWTGREWLVVELTPAPVEDGLLVERMGDMLPEPTGSASTWVHEVTRSR